MPKTNKKGLKPKYTQQNLLMFYTSDDVTSNLRSDIANQLEQDAQSSLLTSQSVSPKAPSNSQSTSSSTLKIALQPLPASTYLEPSATAAQLPSKLNQSQVQLVQCSNNVIVTESNDRDPQYKKKVVQMSCIISKKTIQLNELKKENSLLKSSLNQLQDKIECDLPAGDLQELWKLPVDKSSDMTFVRKSILYFYKDDNHRLRFKSLNGCKSRMIKLKNGNVVQKEAKEPLTPEKVHQIKTLYGKRVDFQGARFAKFNRHVTNSLIRIQERLANAERTQKGALNDGI
jgi:hypothetical protein